VLHGNRARRNDSGNGVFVNHLGDRILKQYHVLVIAFDLALQLDAVDQINQAKFNY
jgi:hypothetical protein